MSVNWASVPKPHTYADLYKNYGDPGDPSFDVRRVLS